MFKNGICKLYVDDVKIYHIFKDDVECNLLQSDIDFIIFWANMWQLKISLAKTVMLHIGYKNAKHVYKMGGKHIESVNTVKDLGVHETYDLSWNTHCFEITKCANKIANITLHSFLCTNLNVYLRAFDIYVMPILDYFSYV